MAAIVPLECNWHDRYVQQAAWTASLRAYLLEKLALPAEAHVLEVGSGTGALLSQMQPHFSVPLHGLDLRMKRLRQSRVHAPDAILTAGNACYLPYADQSFAMVYGHFLLMWVSDPIRALREMRRVARRGGHVLLLAEPDYSARIDFPDTYRALGAAQRAALKDKNAFPDIGRHLPDLCIQAGIRVRESGILGAQWTQPPDPDDWRMEWRVLFEDLKNRMSLETLNALCEQDWQDRTLGRRILFVPLFYVWGQV